MASNGFPPFVQTSYNQSCQSTPTAYRNLNYESHYGQGDYAELMSNESFGQGPYKRARLPSELSFSDFEILGSQTGDQLDAPCEIYPIYSDFPQPTQQPYPTVSRPVEHAVAADVRVNTYLTNPDDPWTTARNREVSYVPTNDLYYSNQRVQVQPKDLASASQIDSAYGSGSQSQAEFLLPEAYPQNRILGSPFPGSQGVPTSDMSPIPDIETLVRCKEPSRRRNGKTKAATKTHKTTGSRGEKKICDVCNKEVACASDLRKHKLIHDKPHKCDVPGCTRTEGFGTTNDLDRHKGSVHKLELARKWRCAAPSCRFPDKLWPRLDNFKQHLERMHKGIDIEFMVKISEVRNTHGSAQDAMDTDLGGIGAGAGSNVRSVVVPDDSRVHRVALPNSQDPYRRHHLNRFVVNGGVLLDNNGACYDLLQSLKNNPVQARQMVESMTETFTRIGNSAETNPDYEIIKGIQDLLYSQLARHTPFNLNGKPSDEETSSTDDRQVSCLQCSKVFSRPCDLRKHMKRHEKPYVCTAAECTKRSGSKHDWQRHERVCQHRGKEYFDSEERIRVCCESDKTNPTGRCGFVHTNETYFVRHLQAAHAITAGTDVDICLRRYEIQFEPGKGWCGFCLKTVPFSESPTRIGDSANFQTGYGSHIGRAEHIDRHIMREGRNMDDYVSLEFHLRKSDCKADKLQSWFFAQRPGNHDPRIHNPSEKLKQSKSRKRRLEESDSAEDRRRKRMNEAKWTCCNCGNYHLFKLHDSCVDCLHKREPCCLETDELQRQHGADIPPEAQIARPPWNSLGEHFDLNAEL